jgi:hypothetical protein
VRSTEDDVNKTNACNRGVGIPSATLKAGLPMKQFIFHRLEGDATTADIMLT